MDLVVASLKNYKFDLNKVVASTGCTCLLMAAQMDNPVAIKSLIKHGADPNLRVAKSDQLNGGGDERAAHGGYERHHERGGCVA